jgi:hypothetical protein
MLSSPSARRQHFGSKCGPPPEGRGIQKRILSLREDWKRHPSPPSGERAAVRAETFVSSDEARAE